MASPLASIESKTQRYVRQMPYLKALIISELTNDLEIYKFINYKDIAFKKNELNQNFLNGLRGGMNELFTDFKKQFQKLKTSHEQKRDSNGGSDNYVVNIMYDKFFVRKQEIANNVLMIAICDVQEDGTSTGQDFELPLSSSSFNIGQLTSLFEDYKADFKQVEGEIDDISKQISSM